MYGKVHLKLKTFQFQIEIASKSWATLLHEYMAHTELNIEVNGQHYQLK